MKRQKNKMEFLTGFTLGIAIGIPFGWFLFAVVKGVYHVTKR